MDIKSELLILITAALPISELRGSIPLGLLHLKEPVLKVVLLSILGNMIPVIPTLFLLQPVSEKLRKFRIFDRFFTWLFNRARKNADLMEKYEALGLAIFVAIPLPATGAWSGCVVASLFKIRFRYALLSILLGVVIAATIVTALCLSGLLIYNK